MEPNNNRNSAQPVSLPLKLKGIISDRTDVDYYKLILDEEETVEITLTSEESIPLRILIIKTIKLLKGHILPDCRLKRKSEMLKSKI